MKYIRTIDGRLVNKSKIICSAFREEYCSPNWNEDIERYLQTKIVAEADTIEELCDCKICHNKTFSIDADRYDIMSSFGDMWFGYEIYGAIWIYDGIGSPTLKSVAKMNGKGELYLL